MTQSQRMMQSQRKKIFAPLEHYDYGQLDKACGCRLCEDLRSTQASYQAALDRVAGHPLGCLCQSCKDKYTARSGYLAANHRRDIYSEASFHAAHEPADLGQRFMEWMGLQVREDDKHTRGWWVIAAAELPMVRWFTEYHKASGAWNMSCSSASGVAA